LTEAPDHAETLATIRKKTDLAHRLRSKRDAGEFRSVGAALALQKVEQDIATLRRELPPLRLITE
jgi:hypothetical protein